jgi:uncharacterized protein YegL
MGIFRKKDERAQREGENRNLPTTILKSPGLKVLEGFREDSSSSEPIIRLTKFLRERFGLGRGDTVTLKKGAVLLKARVEVSSAADGLEEACRLNRTARDILGAALGDQIEVIPPETLILLIDTSGSMGDFVSGLVKIEATKNAVREFIRSKFLMGQEDRAGIISFGEYATVVEKPTTDYEHLENRSATLFPNGATAMYEGMGLAIDHLYYAGGMKRIVLLTDGVPTTTGRQAVLSLAKKAASLKIVIDTVGVGSPFDFMGYDEALLRRIAAITGGTFRRVIDIQELTGQFRELAEGKNYTYLLPGK